MGRAARARQERRVSGNLTVPTVPELAPASGLRPVVAEHLERDAGPYAEWCQGVRTLARLVESNQGEGHMLDRLQVLALLQRFVDESVPLWVAQARYEGASWADVGAAFSITRQAAHMRYAHLVEADHA